MKILFIFIAGNWSMDKEYSIKLNDPALKYRGYNYD